MPGMQNLVTPPVRSRVGLVLAFLSVSLAPLASEQTPAATLSEHARNFQKQLREMILPYWHDTTVDRQHGGFLLADDLKGRGQARDKQLVSQTRMVWAFAHAHLNGYSNSERDYLAAARGGYRFLLEHFRDREHGGYYWKTDLAGRPIHDCKFLYGQAFVIYALVEYQRASGDAAALDHALALYDDLQRHLHDPAHGGWLEHTEADWTPLKPGDPRNEVEVVGYKSANAHLHWMEALAELYEVSRHPAVRGSLEESLRINQQYFYPLAAGRSCFHRHPDWSEVTDPRSAGLSYGHNVEFAWLMIRAEQVLGLEPSWEHFHRHLEHALKYGTDLERGGLYSRGVGDQPADDTTKVWWSQAEMLAALADGLQHRPDPLYHEALVKLIEFVLAHQVDPRDGIWLDTVAADGTHLRTGKAHNWKTAYHDVRAIQKFVAAFGAKD
jgi:mannose/cellobiose epimerase-like protein (N-acyl-D-glucosamine 2-epimerase family)